ncbi:hypothetical protein [Amycolatopsis sp. lyj-90]
MAAAPASNTTVGPVTPAGPGSTIACSRLPSRVTTQSGSPWVWLIVR